MRINFRVVGSTSFALPG